MEKKFESGCPSFSPRKLVCKFENFCKANINSKRQKMFSKISKN